MEKNGETMKRLQNILLITISFLALLSSCGAKEPSKTPTEITTYYMDTLLKGENNDEYSDSTKMNNLAFRKSYITSFSQSFWNSADIGATEEDTEKLSEAMDKALKAVEYTVVSEESDGGKATVIIELRGLGINEKVFDDNALIVYEEATNKGIQDFEDVKPLLIESIIGLYSNPVLAEKQEVEIKLSKKSNEWVVVTTADEIMTNYVYPTPQN